MTLHQLLEKIMSTDITPVLHFLEISAILYVVGYLVAFVFILIGFFVLMKNLFR